MIHLYIYKYMYMYISLGPTCHPAGNLKSLNLRNQAFPFDWLLCNGRLFEW